MQIGFIVTKTPTEEGFQTFLEFLKFYQGKEDIHVYLVGSGVFCAKQGHQQSHKIHMILENGVLYAMEEDLIARGISPEQTFSGTKIISGYPELVHEIMEKMDQVMSF